jgi:WD40 repeat protein
MSRVFLSHSSDDNFEAIALRDWLASEGWNDVFLDLDPERGIAAGERWERALHAAANRCEAVIFLVSGNWLASGWCLREYSLARGLNKKLFATLIDATKTIASLPPEMTGVWQIVDLVHGQDLRLFPTKAPGSYEERHVGYSRSGLLRLKRGLEKAGLDARFFVWPPEAEQDRAPYRGLKPQEAADAGIFFGRDAPIVEAIDRLRGLRAGATPRLLVILGASGAGKSSFLRAGLLPRLSRDDTQFIALPVVRPERAAITGETGLVNALAAILPTHSRADLRAAAQAGATALRPLLAELVQAAVVRRVAGDETERPPVFVVAIDQAEELFRAEGREESAALLALLADLAGGDDPDVIVVFTIRSDSYDALQNAKALEDVRQVPFSLLPMPRGAYLEVIEGPARRLEEAGRKLAIESTLTQRLLVDVEAGAGDALPLLAFTLEQLYLDYRQTGALRLADYEKFGGLKGAIDAAVERAFARADADARIPRDREARLALLRRGLIPWLAGVDPDSKTPRRNIARRADIPAEAAPLIDLLVEERLLSVDTRSTRDPKTGAETHQSTIEPTHEALLRQWGLLDGWLKEDFGLLSSQEGIKRAARDWDANARADSWLAHQGQRLAEAQALDARPDVAARLDATDRAYLAGCRAREEAARAETEQRRRERDEEQARRLADARKIALRTGVGAVVALLFAIAAGTFGYYALSEKTLAFQKTAEAITEKDKADAAIKDVVAQKALADQKTEEAIEQKNKADEATKEAVAQKTTATRNESFALTALAASEAEHRPVKAAKLALATWPRDAADTTVSKRPATLDALGRIVPNLRERRILENVVGFAIFSPDGTRIATGSPRPGVQIWDAASGRVIATLSGHSDKINSAAFSNDGTQIVTASEDNTARIWDAFSGRAIATLEGHEGAVISAAFSRDGTRIVTASDDETARLWDVASSRSIATLKGHGGSVLSAAFSPTGTRVITASDDGTARVWDAASGGAVAILPGVGAPIVSAAFSPNGTRIVTASTSGAAWLWDAASGRAIASLKGSDIWLYSAVFSPDGTLIVTASADGSARLWDAATGRAVATFEGHEGHVLSAAFSPDGTRVVTTSNDNTARLWDVATRRTVATFAGHEGEVVSGAFSPDGTRVLTASEDGTARLWDAIIGRAVTTLAGHTASINSAAFSPSGTHIVTASNDKTACVWDVATGRVVSILTGHGNGVTSAAFSPDGTQIVTASWDKTARLWDATSGRVILTLSGHEKGVISAAFSPDGKRIVTSSDDRTARIWDAKSAAEIAVLRGHESSVYSAAFSPDGSRVVTASDDETARVWDATTGQTILTLKGHEGAVFRAEFSPDGRRIITASYDNTARLWDATTGRTISTLDGHSAPVNFAAFSRDGERIVTASEDKTARIWDAATGRALAILRGHTDRLLSAAFSPDSARVVTASSDKTSRVWDVSTIPTGNILQVTCKLLNQNFGLDGVTDFPLTFNRPICASDPPPPDLETDLAAQAPAK